LPAQEIRQPLLLKPLFHEQILFNALLTLTLHKFFSSGIADMRETVVFSGQMLDA